VPLPPSLDDTFGANTVLLLGPTESSGTTTNKPTLIACHAVGRIPTSGGDAGVDDRANVIQPEEDSSGVPMNASTR
jgi:hypothetical protein